MTNIVLNQKTYEELQEEIIRLNTENFLKDIKIKRLEDNNRKVVRKLKSTINHYKDNTKEWALKYAIELLEGERKWK